MKSAAKVAISVPAETLRAVERFRRRVGKSRSAVFAEAVEAWIRQQTLGDEDRRYMESYLRRPERDVEAAATAGAAISVWEPWE